MGHLRLTIGYLKATVVHIRVTLGPLIEAAAKNQTPSKTAAYLSTSV